MSKSMFLYSLFIAFTLGYTVRGDYSRALGDYYGDVAWWYFALGHFVILLLCVIYNWKRLGVRSG